MASMKETSTGLEWTVKISDGSPVEPVLESSRLLGLILAVKSKLRRFVEKIKRLVDDDPRRVFHCFKVGLALTLVSLCYYMRPVYNGVGGTAIWAVLTVVVVFEYSVGATLSKSLNRGMATLVAGSLGVAVHWLGNQSGEKAEPIILSFFVFLLASTATFSRFIPTVKTRFDYGITIFILTFSLVSVSGYRVEKLVELAYQRLSTVAIGGAMCILISIFIRPVWAGKDLHRLITRNMEKLANSLDGCVTEYFNESESITGDKEPFPKLQGYKCVLNSKASEESLANFARWEPPHGRFGFRHPWKQYLKIGNAMRCCAYRLVALNSATNSEIKAPQDMKSHLSDVCMRLSSHSSGVLKELATATKCMRRSSRIQFLLGEMNGAVEDLQNALKSLPCQLARMSLEAKDKEKHPCVLTADVALAEVMPLVTVTSLLIEIVGRIQEIVNSGNELARNANFKPADGDELK